MPGPRWLFVTVSAFVISLALLVRAARRLIRVWWPEPFATVALAPPGAGSDAIEAAIELAAPGVVAITAEGRRATRDFAGLSIELAAARTGEPVPVRRKRLAVTTSGVSRVRMKLWTAEIPAAGSYTVSVHGLRPERSYAESRLLFIPDLAVLGRILAVVALGIACVGSLVASGLLAFASRTSG